MNAQECPIMTLHVLTYRDQPSDLACTFGEAGGTLGRSAESDLVLDDPGKYISRIHARVLWRDGSFVFCSLGTNPVFVNDVPLLTGQEGRLAHLAKIRIGDYLLEAILPHTAAKAPDHGLAEPTPPIHAMPARQPARKDAPHSTEFFTAPPETDPLGLDLYGGAMTSASATHGRAAATTAYRGAESDHLPPQNQSFASFKGAGSTVIPDDYDPMADHAHTAGAGSQSGDKNAAAGADNGAALVAAFMKGLGQPGLQTEMSPLVLAELAGAILREATVGTMGALKARSLTKRESRIEVTMLAQQANNPLKFFPDADMALAQMLGRSTNAYLSPVRAFNSAFDDLKAHELAVLAAMRAAMSAVLEQLSPQAIEQKLPTDTAIDKMFSVNRKARCWDSLVREYGEISSTAEDKLSRIFSEKFSHAYEDQISRIRKAKR